MQLNNRDGILGERFMKFVFLGGLNTIATYLLYLVLSKLFHYQLAYVISYVTGIFLAYLLNLIFVFKAQSTIKKAMSYPFIYVMQYLLGAGLMYLLLSVFDFPNALAPVVVAALLLPISYFLNKKILVN